MSRVRETEREIREAIERLEMEAREVRQRLERAIGQEDKRVIAGQLAELEQQVDCLCSQLVTSEG